MEETTTHLQNCEILWRFRTDVEDRAGKVRLLKGKPKERTIGSETAPAKGASVSDDPDADFPTDFK